VRACVRACMYDRRTRETMDWRAGGEHAKERELDRTKAGWEGRAFNKAGRKRGDLEIRKDLRAAYPRTPHCSL